MQASAFYQEMTVYAVLSQTPYYMGYVAEVSRRFFHPAAIDEMLEHFLPQFVGTSLDVSV